ncbi:MAG TPA: carboxypeptidase-like regulatory domain-containing protein [Gemmatimonadaceae bacterium]|nr:carboxypeptidase-like regulatory domain-containing protein [Gemmatimonadaceae bacterium]
MRKIFAAAMTFVAASFAMPVGVFAGPAKAKAPQAQGTGGLTGTAKDAASNNLSQVKVQVRPVNPAPGQGLAATGTTNAAGTFSFAGLAPGQYVVEIIDLAGNIVGTTSAVTVTAGAVTTVSITAAAAGAIAAAGAAGVGGGLLGLGTIGTVAVIGGAIAAAVVGIRAVQDDASPSR